MSHRSYGLTDVGKKRDHNEDCFLASDELGLYIVADGMGGHAAGEVASAKAVEVIGEFVRRCKEDEEFTWPYGINPELGELQNILVTAVKLANREVWQMAQDQADQKGMGTTVVAMTTDGVNTAIAHVGDSRLYLVRDGKIIQKTRDHSWVNEQLVRGIISPEEAKGHRWKNVITRALGNKEQIEVEIAADEMRPGDIIMLCSDGLCLGDGVEEEQVLEQILEHESDLKTAAQMLIGLANEAGGKDNITAVLLKCFASEEDADREMRDASQDETNPMALQSIAPPGMDDIEQTAQVIQKPPVNEENQLSEPIDFEEDGDDDLDEDDFATPAMGVEKADGGVDVPIDDTANNPALSSDDLAEVFDEDEDDDEGGEEANEESDSDDSADDDDENKKIAAEATTPEAFKVDDEGETAP